MRMQIILKFSNNAQYHQKVPETIFELLISRRITVRNTQAFLPQLHGEQEYA